MACSLARPRQSRPWSTVRPTRTPGPPRRRRRLARRARQAHSSLRRYRWASIPQTELLCDDMVYSSLDAGGRGRFETDCDWFSRSHFEQRIRAQKAALYCMRPAVRSLSPMTSSLMMKLNRPERRIRTSCIAPADGIRRTEDGRASIRTTSPLSVDHISVDSNQRRCTVVLHGEVQRVGARRGGVVWQLAFRESTNVLDHSAGAGVIGVTTIVR